MPGCGASDIHGGVCGFHAGVSTGGAALVGPKIPGRGFAPAGVAIPLPNGV
jgi:hypothetical protein